MIILILALLGLCLGSFVNALVWRLREQDKVKSRKLVKSKASKSQDLSILKGRSMCPHCKHTLAVQDLLPVVSWLTLGGKCRYCHKPISWQYPLVELLTAALFVKSYFFWPYVSGGDWKTSTALLLGVWLAIVTLFVALTIYDLRWMLLPDKLVYIVLGLAVLFVGMRAMTNAVPGTVVIDSLLGLLSVGGLFYVLFQVSGGKWIGGGDVKLGFGLGLLAGSLENGLLLVFVASALGSLVAIPLLLTGKKALTGKLPFGPFLMAATVVVVLWGADVVSWYQRVFLGV